MGSKQLELDDLLQTATMWEVDGHDKFGQVKIKPPVEIACRWSQGAEIHQDNNSTVKPIKATVKVDRPIPLRSVMRLGDKDSIPNPPDNLFQVINQSEIPDIKCRGVRYMVHLGDLHDTLPVIL